MPRLLEISLQRVADLSSDDRDLARHPQNDFLAAKKFDHLGREVKHAGNDGIEGGGDTGYKFRIPGAQNNPDAMRPQ